MAKYGELFWMHIRSLDLELLIQVKKEKTPLIAKLNGVEHTLEDGENFFPISITEIDQIIEAQFNGFNHHEKLQEIEIKLFYKNKKLSIEKIISFAMQGNLYVDNVLMHSYNKIHFNGSLFLKFPKEWIECEVVSGFSLSKNKEEFISIVDRYDSPKKFIDMLEENKNKSHYLAIVGTCNQTESKRKFTPSLYKKLKEEYPKESLLNFSSDGLNDWCILHNSFWLLKNLKVKNLLLTLNVGTYISFKAKIFDHFTHRPFLHAPDNGDFLYEEQFKIYRFNRKRMQMWEKILNLKLDRLIEECKKTSVKPIIINYGGQKIWHDKHLIDWHSLYKENKNIDLDKRTEITNNQVFEKISDIIS